MSESLSTTDEPKFLRIFDTTLRDGLQGRGANTTLDGELEIAQALIDAEMDAIEAGCPSAIPEEKERVRRIVRMSEGTRTEIAAFAMCRADTIHDAQESLEGAGERSVVSLLTSVSDDHLDAMFPGQNKYEQATRKFIEHTALASRGGLYKVHAYLEDATRANRAYILDLVPQLCEAGATTISVPDTNGVVNDPDWYGELISQVKERVLQGVLVSAHTHGDTGLAVANALKAVKSGADQVECTLTGWGEGVGNCPTEEFLYNLLRGPGHYHRLVRLNLPMVYPALRTFVREAGLDVHRKKPLLGHDTHGTSAGIHQGKLRRNRGTYERTNAEFLGFPGPGARDLMVFGRSSGRNAVLHALEQEGFSIDRNDPRLTHIITHAKTLARSTEDGEIPLEVVAALALNEIGDHGKYSLDSSPDYKRVGETETVFLKIKDTQTGEVHSIEASGTRGIISAACHGISDFIGLKLHIDEERLKPRYLGEGEDSTTFIRARLVNGDHIFEGLGLHPDQNEAGIQAILRAFNRACESRDKHGSEWANVDAVGPITTP